VASAAPHHIDLAAYLLNESLSMALITTGGLLRCNSRNGQGAVMLAGGKSWVARIIHSCTIRYSVKRFSQSWRSLTSTLTFFFAASSAYNPAKLQAYPTIF